MLFGFFDDEVIELFDVLLRLLELLSRRP